MSRVFNLPSAETRSVDVEKWLLEHDDALGLIAQDWFTFLRACGDDVRELIHDGQPTACVGEAAFAYVAVYSSHVNLGFYSGAELPDPDGLLEGTGKFMRHIKLKPQSLPDTKALQALINAAYSDMKSRV